MKVTFDLLPRMIGGVMRSIVAWSRIFDDAETLLAINTDASQSGTGWVTIDKGLHVQATTLTCLYATDASLVGQKFQIEDRNGKSVHLTVPPAGFVIYQ